MNTKQSIKTRSLVEVALFAAIILLLAYTPFIGYIPVGPVRATTIHIPVIIGAIILGGKKGAILGFIFGLTSFINSSFISPSIMSFMFSPFYPGGNIFSLVICFLPRILIGVNSYWVYQLIKKLFPKSESVAVCIGALVGSLTNTILVMGLTYIFFADKYAQVNDIAREAVIGVILGIVGTNGIPEAIVAAIISTAVCKALFAVKRRAS